MSNGAQDMSNVTFGSGAKVTHVTPNAVGAHFGGDLAATHVEMAQNRANTPNKGLGTGSLGANV